MYSLKIANLSVHEHNHHCQTTKFCDLFIPSSLGINTSYITTSHFYTAFTFHLLKHFNHIPFVFQQETLFISTCTMYYIWIYILLWICTDFIDKKKRRNLVPTKLNAFTVDNSLEAIQSRNEADHPTALIGWECIFTVEIGSSFFPSTVESFSRGDDAVRSKILTVPANCIFKSYKYIILCAMHDLTNDYNANKMLYS